MKIKVQRTKPPRLSFGVRWENVFIARGVLEVYPKWRDLWVGVFVGPDAIYVCPLPCVVFRFSRGSRRDPVAYMRAEMAKVMTKEGS